tara:strand:+ start:276 stop:608 length:333 start_codon:yes stop_codon:yes gene_type:complete
LKNFRFGYVGGSADGFHFVCVGLGDSVGNACVFVDLTHNGINLVRILIEKQQLFYIFSAVSGQLAAAVFRVIVYNVDVAVDGDGVDELFLFSLISHNEKQYSITSEKRKH